MIDTLPTHEIPEHVYPVEVGVFTAAVDVASSDRLAHLVRVRINRKNVVWGATRRKHYYTLITYVLLITVGWYLYFMLLLYLYFLYSLQITII